jgi:hypothetical protein
MWKGVGFLDNADKYEKACIADVFILLIIILNIVAVFSKTDYL